MPLGGMSMGEVLGTLSTESLHAMGQMLQVGHQSTSWLWSWVLTAST